jgi:hypothetical protein
VWFFYGGEFFDTRIVWMDMKSRLLVNARLADRESQLLAVDRDSTSYYCASNFNANVNCAALELGSDIPNWRVSLNEAGSGYVGGAVVEGRLYAATSGGILFAVGDK